MYEAVEFSSEGATLRGRFYRHESGAPAVVMAHGLSATLTMCADRYAEAFHAAGFNVLLFDHRNFGISDGEPRGQINPWIQGRGYRDAVVFLRAERLADSVVLWGDSYSAMVVLVSGALIERVSAIIAQVPATGAALPAETPSEQRLAALRDFFEKGDVAGTPETTGPERPVVSADQINAPSLLAPVQAFRWFVEYGGRHGSGWVNRASGVNPPAPVPFHPALTAPFLTCPVLFVAGRDDEFDSCDLDVQRAVFDRIPTESEFHIIDGGHFGLLWHPSREFDEAAELQAAFLHRVLPG